MAYFGDCKAHGLRADMVNAYVSQRLENGAANATINRELAALKRMFNLGLKSERIYRKPYIPMLKEDNVRAGFFEHGEFIALQNALPEYFKPVSTFAYYTGWRKQEILNLRWNQVDLNARTVRLEPGTTKNDKGQAVNPRRRAVGNGQGAMGKAQGSGDTRTVSDAAMSLCFPSQRKSNSRLPR
jgi:integrase